MAEGGIKVAWRSLFAPSSWAFAIWGAIYTGELLTTLYVGLKGREELRSASLFWLAGNVFQCLWCAVFRPRFKSALWLPALMLGLSSASFFGAHNQISLAISSKPDFAAKIPLLLLRAPIALHCAWVAGASLLNLNGWAAVSNLPLFKQLSIAYASVYSATLLGAGYSLYSKDPLVGLTVAWTLAALYSKTQSDCDVKIDPVAVESLAFTENLLSKSMVALSIVAPIASSIATKKMMF